MNAKQMSTFLDERWAFHRSQMQAPEPQTQRTSCTRYWEHNGQPYAAHGGDWDRWEWRGDSYGSEHAYCQCCGSRSYGTPSPWASRALEDWYATPYMQASFRASHIRNAYSGMRKGFYLSFPRSYKILIAN